MTGGEGCGFGRHPTGSGLTKSSAPACGGMETVSMEWGILAPDDQRFDTGANGTDTQFAFFNDVGHPFGWRWLSAG